MKTLSLSPLVELEEMPDVEIDSAAQDRRVAAGLLIPAGYEAALASGRPLPLEYVRLETVSGAQSAREAVEGALLSSHLSFLAIETASLAVSEAMTNADPEQVRSLVAPTVASLLSHSAVRVTTIAAGRGQSTPGESPESDHASGFEQSSPGGLVNWVLFGLLTVTTGVAWERRRGLLRRLVATGLSGPHIVGGKVLAMVMVTFVQQLLLVILGQAAFGVRYFSSPAALLLTMLSLSVFAASFGLLISSLFRREQAIVATTVLSAQSLAALGGAWFPLEITSPGFSRVAHVFPTTWVMDCLHGLTLSGWGLSDVLVPLGYVWAWTVILFGLAVWRFRPE